MGAEVVARLGTALPLLLAALAGGAPQDEPSREALQFYESRIRPLLAERCYSCHSARAPKLKGGLGLDTREGITRGGESGAAVVRGDPEASRLIRAVRRADPDLGMPPKEAERLAPRQVEDLAAWVRMGAPMPKAAAGPAPRSAADLSKAREFWSFRAVVETLPPEARDAAWARTPIDRFILAKLESNGLLPSKEAERSALLRRVTIDLIGLPPAVAELRAFLADSSADAYEQAVDRLLATPHYGERWGRHWMDVWRYADQDPGRMQTGLQIAPHMWRWRDWIVDSLNADKGYDRMVQEMLAGDELAPGDPDALRATAYLARNKATSRDMWLHDTVDHVSQAFLGLTLQCARCHDHPLDPIAQTDYYRLRAFFEPLAIRTDTIPGGDPKKDGLTRAYDEKLDAKTHLYVRGNEFHPDLSTAFPAGVPAVLDRGGLSVEEIALPEDGQGKRKPAGKSSGRRLALARWITDPAHPLAARVAVNHLWLRHFGQALVPTVNDFGAGGARPTHPELLDWLAGRFVRDGWSMKKLHRLVVTSSAYRMDSAPRAEGIAKDPDNVLLWRMNARRVEGEVVRDSILALAGRLDPAMKGPPLDPGETGSAPRRSLYFLHSPYRQMTFLRAFDGAPVEECYQRTESIHPRQALALLNSDLALAGARALAGELGPQSGGDAPAFVELAYEKILARAPRPDERRVCVSFLEERARGSGEPGSRASLVHLLLNHHEFVTVR